MIEREARPAWRNLEYQGRLWEDRGTLMWDVELPVLGRCPECGDDLTGTVRIHSTAGWIERYHSDDRLFRGINRSVERIIVERHARVCAARRSQRKVFAATA